MDTVIIIFSSRNDKIRFVKTSNFYQLLHLYFNYVKSNILLLKKRERDRDRLVFISRYLNTRQVAENKAVGEVTCYWLCRTQIYFHTVQSVWAPKY